MLGIDDPPAVELVRAVSKNEYYLVQQQCLLEQGFRTELNAAGDELTVHLADGQAGAFFEADYVCGGRFPLHEAYVTELDRRQIQTYYEWNAGTLSECMTTHGFTVSTPPTLEVFVERYEAGRGLWTPFDEVPEELWLETVTEVAKECQLEPDDEDVYGNLD